MCGRFVQDTPGATLADYYGLAGPAESPPRYNIAPGQPVQAIRLEAGNRVPVRLHWGLLPHWAKERSFGYKTFNARAEKVHQTASFRAAFRTRRCLVPASGFYEWQKLDSGKQPYYIHRSDGAPVTFAGLWESWDDPQSEAAVESCTILTTAANSTISAIHHRMPVILERDAFATWLDPDITTREPLEPLLQPAGESLLELYPVSTAVNRAEYDSPDCTRPLT